MKKQIYGSALLSLMFVLANCKSESENTGGGNAAPSASPSTTPSIGSSPYPSPTFSPTPSVTICPSPSSGIFLQTVLEPRYYDPEIKNLINTHCVSCHGPGAVGKSDLSTQAGVLAVKQAIVTKVTALQMPPASKTPLTALERNSFELWAAAGYPISAALSSPSPSSGVLVPTPTPMIIPGCPTPTPSTLPALNDPFTGAARQACVAQGRPYNPILGTCHPYGVVANCPTIQAAQGLFAQAGVQQTVYMGNGSDGRIANLQALGFQIYQCVTAANYVDAIFYTKDATGNYSFRNVCYSPQNQCMNLQK